MVVPSDFIELLIVNREYGFLLVLCSLAWYGRQILSVFTRIVERSLMVLFEALRLLSAVGQIVALLLLIALLVLVLLSQYSEEDSQ